MIPTHEDLTTEFKSDADGLRDSTLIETVVGLANTKGGTLFVGVEDDGRITGINERHRDSIGVVALIANRTVPPVSVRAEIISAENKDVLVTHSLVNFYVCTVHSTYRNRTVYHKLHIAGTGRLFSRNGNLL